MMTSTDFISRPLDGVINYGGKGFQGTIRDIAIFRVALKIPLEKF